MKQYPGDWAYNKTYNIGRTFLSNIGRTYGHFSLSKIAQTVARTPTSGFIAGNKSDM
jgi:hypothetical protein